MTEKANVIEFDTNTPCSRCGQIGSTGKGGICLDCVTNRLSKIGPKTIKAVADQVEAMLFTYQKNLNQAYPNEENLRIAFSVDIGPGTGGDLVVTTKISCIESRGKDETQTTVNGRQEGVFEED